MTAMVISEVKEFNYNSPEKGNQLASRRIWLNAEGAGRWAQKGDNSEGPISFDLGMITPDIQLNS